MNRRPLDIGTPGLAKPLVCFCAAYKFPHRAGGGKCEAAPGINRMFGRQTLSQLCSCCGLVADTHEEDFGYGPTEFWGDFSNHSDWRVVTDCCEGELVPNTAAEAAKHPEWRKK